MPKLLLLDKRDYKKEDYGEEENNFKINPLTDIPVKKVDDDGISKTSSTRIEIENHSHKISKKDAGESPAGKKEDDAHLYLFKSKFYRVIRSWFLVSNSERIHRGDLFRSHADIHLEKTRQVIISPFIIHPYSIFRFCWELIMIFLLFGTLVWTPIPMTFYQEYLTNHILACSLLNIPFALDILVNFFTGVRDKWTDVVVLSSSQIARLYLQRLLLIDIITSIPFEAIFSYKGSRILQNLQILKFFRIFRAFHYLTKLEKVLDIPRIYSRFLNLLIVIGILLHWFSCLQFIAPYWWSENLSHQVLENSTSWKMTFPGSNSTSLSSKYLIAFFRSISYMTLLGAERQIPGTSGEIFLALIMIMTGVGCLIALFIFSLVIFNDSDMSESKYYENLREIEEYMRFKHMPKHLQDQVKLYLKRRWRKRYFQEDFILNELSHNLRTDMMMFNCRRLVENVPIFADIPKHIIQNIVTKLKYEIYLSNEEIITAKTIGNCMYFIDHGLVGIITPNGIPLSYLKDGDFFGELSLITNERRIASVIAIEHSDLYRLDRVDFQNAIVEDYPEIYSRIIQIAEKRTGVKIGDKLVNDDLDFDREVQVDDDDEDSENDEAQDSESIHPQDLLNIVSIEHENESEQNQTPGENTTKE